MFRSREVRPVSQKLIAGVLVLATFPVALSPLAAAPLEQATDSLSLAPVDAAFYSSMLRNKEQIDLVVGSKAWAELNSMPIVQLGKTLAQLQLNSPDSPLTQVKQFFAVPENQQLLDVLTEMVSDEVFLYGNADFGKLADLMAQLNGARRLAPALSLAIGQDGEEIDPNEAQIQFVMDVLLENLDSIVVPELVIGFKVTSKDAAEAQLQRLEAITGLLLGAQPELKDRFKRETIGQSEYLTIKLDEKLVPWEEIPRDELPISEEELEKLLKHLKSLTVQIALGIHGDYVVLSIGPTNEHLANLGQGDSLLSRPEFERLKPFADKRLTGISYVSQEFMSEVSASREDLEAWADLAEQLLPSAELDAELEKRILADIDKLVDECQSYLCEPGAIAGCSFITERGVESYLFNWAKNQVIDSSKRLTLLEHIGGAPLLATVSRAKYSPESYAKLVDWLKKVHAYFEEIAVPKMEEEEQQQYQQVMTAIGPLLARLDKATGTMLLPALADGQTGLVIDSKLTSRQWHKALPATAEPLPILEPALIFGVSDRDLLIKAMSEYRSIFNDALRVAAELSEGELEIHFELPAPQTREFSVGKVYFYHDLAKDAGLDKLLAPNAGLSDDVAVLTIAPRHTLRLLTKTPISSAGPLGEANRPLGSASYFDFSGLLDVLTPWIDLGVRMATREPDGDDIRDRDDFVADEREPISGEGIGNPADDSPATKQILDQVHTGLRILKVLRGCSSIFYEDDGVQVTRRELRIVDLE